MDNVHKMVMFDPDMGPYHFNRMDHSYAICYQQTMPLSLYPHKGTLHRRDNPDLVRDDGFTLETSKSLSVLDTVGLFFSLIFCYKLGKASCAFPGTRLVPSVLGVSEPEPAPTFTPLHVHSTADNDSIFASTPPSSSLTSSPITSSVSTAASTNPTHPQRPPSHSQTPSASATSPCARTKTPSHIPALSWSHFRALSDMQWDDGDPTTSLMQRALSPDPSPPRAMTPGGTRLSGPHPPSCSMIPAPVFHVSSPSRPGSTLSDYRDLDRNGRASPTQSNVSFRITALRAQTPEATLRSRPQAVPFYGSISAGSGSNNSPRAVRPLVSGAKLPPSSFHDMLSSMPAPRTPSRPSSRLSDFGSGSVNSLYLYKPSNMRDLLDTEVAAIVNSIVHGLLIERVDPAEDNPALTTLSRAGAKGELSMAMKKVMVRVGGGWQDLQLYMLNRAAGM
ncbi:hypothetical protein EDB83DRAFT_2658657 [Lactarius deliciosus]|nr:hypothetical protein EDB83DRAFT_2658657 [Lactarius deliciosus]